MEAHSATREKRRPYAGSTILVAAIAAGALLAAAFLIGFVLFSDGGGAGVDQSGRCVGGPVMGASGRDVSGNGTKFVIPCAVSGTVTVSSPIDH